MTRQAPPLPDGTIEGWQDKLDEAQTQTHTAIDGRDYPRIAYGDEDDLPLSPKPRCRDCGCELGQLHVPTCCVERCPRCRGQAISCGCLDRDDDDDELRH